MCLRTGTDIVVGPEGWKGREIWYKIMLKWILRNWKVLGQGLDRSGSEFVQVSGCCEKSD